MTDRSRLRLIENRHDVGAPTDEALVLRFQADPQGEDGRAAAATLLERYRDRVQAWCLRRLADPDAAQDIAQETLMAALAALPEFGGRSLFSSWLFAIARNRCLSALRARPRPADGEEALAEVADRTADPLDDYLARESQEIVLELMNRVLDREERTVLWLRAYEELSVAEITMLLDLPGAAGARAVLQRARRRLRAAFEARHASAGEKEQP